MIPTPSRIVAGAVVSVAFLIAAAGVAAQPNGRPGPPPTAPGQAKKVTPSSNVVTPPIQSVSEPSRRLHTFGSWLDTADVNAPGETWMWVSSTYWQSPALREINAPAIGVSVGVAPRAQLSVSVPYYFLADRSGVTSRGLGAWYVTPKLALTRNHRVNVSTSPTLEILNWSSPDIRRLNFLLPVSIQSYAGAFRVYGSTGYASRGSVFGSGALDWFARDSLTFTTTVAHSHSVVSDSAGDALGLPRYRTDASAGLSLSLRPTVVFFASIGRTFNPVDDTSGRLALAGGVTVNIAGRGTNVPRTQ